MWFDKGKFIARCNEIVDDIDDGKLRSPGWIWIGAGALTGLVLSALRLRRKSGKPILASFERVNKRGE